jgi:hypothetical protein
MAIGRSIGFAVLGLLLGGMLGGGAGLLGGLGYTQMAETSGFEGYSGYVVAMWMLAGILIGMIAGIAAGLQRSRR